MSTRVVRYWPKDKPMPPGWVLTENWTEYNNHAEYSVLIRRLSWWERIERAFVRWIGPPQVED